MKWARVVAVVGGDRVLGTDPKRAVPDGRPARHTIMDSAGVMRTWRTTEAVPADGDAPARPARPTMGPDAGIVHAATEAVRVIVHHAGPTDLPAEAAAMLVQIGAVRMGDPDHVLWIPDPIDGFSDALKLANFGAAQQLAGLYEQAVVWAAFDPGFAALADGADIAGLNVIGWDGVDVVGLGEAWIREVERFDSAS